MNSKANRLIIGVLLFYVITYATFWFIFEDINRASTRILAVAVFIVCIYKGLNYSQQGLSLFCAFEAIGALALINRLEAPLWITTVIVFYGLTSAVLSVVVFQSTDIKELINATANGDLKKS